MDDAFNPRLIENGENIALLSDAFFVVNDDMDAPDRFLVVQRQADYAATVIGRFKDFDYAHYCAKRLSEYVAKHRLEEEQP